jgi:uncharacterized protein
MAEMTHHDPGSFCWVELATNDTKGAKEFYGRLFGWSFAEGPMGPGPDDIYTRLQLRGKDAGALYPMMQEQRAQGVPPFWLCYVAVESADAAAAAAKSLGGKVVAEPFDVMDYGRMAILQDPSGATLAVWQAGTHAGFQIFGETNAPCWLELATRDVAAAKKFYSGVFGWSLKDPKDPKGMPYVEIERAGRSLGGMYPMGPEMAQVPPNWTVYFQTQDCDAAAARAGTLSGRVIVPTKEIPTVGRFAVIQDPQGAVFSLYQPA